MSIFHKVTIIHFILLYINIFQDIAYENVSDQIHLGSSMGGFGNDKVNPFQSINPSTHQLSPVASPRFSFLMEVGSSPSSLVEDCFREFVEI